MKLTQAINKVAAGAVILSCTGKRYSNAELSPKWYGLHYAIFNSAGMSEVERKGNWELVETQI